MLIGPNRSSFNDSRPYALNLLSAALAVGLVNSSSAPLAFRVVVKSATSPGNSACSAALNVLLVASVALLLFLYKVCIHAVNFACVSVSFFW